MTQLTEMAPRVGPGDDPSIAVRQRRERAKIARWEAALAGQSEVRLEGLMALFQA